MTQTQNSGATATETSLIGKVVEYQATGANARGGKDGKYKIIESAPISANRQLIICQNIDTEKFVIFEASTYSFLRIPELHYPSQTLCSRETAERNFKNKLNRVNMLQHKTADIRNISRMVI